jgi:hypothetical protein
MTIKMKKIEKKKQIWGEFNQSTLYACMEYHNETHFVQLIYANKKEKETDLGTGPVSTTYCG